MAQIGNQNARKGKMWRDAVQKCLESWPDKPKLGKNAKMIGLYEAAYKYCHQIIEGGSETLMKDLADRLDGKPQQSIDLEVGGEFTAIERQIVKAKDSDS